MSPLFPDPVRREIWTTLRALNDAWTQGQAQTLSDYFHPRMVAITASDRRRREGQAACLAGWQAFAAASSIQRWREIEPLIEVFGDAAVVTYYYEISFTMADRRVQQDGRDMFFFVRENGRWWAVADQFSPYPA
ncbi:MAG: nuclear transport factor 2 family protein [Bacteroidota bacterium]